MRITADTNVLVRAVLEDDPEQSATARSVLSNAEAIYIPLPVLCEFAWVLRRGRRLSPEGVAAEIRILMQAATVVADRLAVEAGLAVADAGGDFADGVIAHEGRGMGSEAFVSFDKKAVRLLSDAGLPARLLS
ncbi:MAG: type II toxin-antitoxin system VapC family toxin [Pseudomonadota bacterium]